MKFFIILAYNSEILSKFAEAKKKSDETYKDCIEMNMPRYRKNACGIWLFKRFAI